MILLKKNEFNNDQGWVLEKKKRKTWHEKECAFLLIKKNEFALPVIKTYFDLKETFITQHYKKPRVIWAF